MFIPWVAGHMLRKVGEKNCQVETDLFGRIMESLREFDIVNFAIVIGIATRQHEIDLLPDTTKEKFLYISSWYYMFLFWEGRVRRWTTYKV